MTIDGSTLTEIALLRALTQDESGEVKGSTNHDVPATLELLRAEVRRLRARRPEVWTPLAATSTHWPRVLRFALIMDRKLNQNVHKGDWRPAGSAGAKWFVARLKAELYELEAELQGNPFRSHYDREAIALECADIANFALMIADVFGALGDVA